MLRRISWPRSRRWSWTTGGRWSSSDRLGKSAVYFLATRLLRDQGGGPTLLVSPLLSLMRDQIAKAEGIGIRAATINSTNLDQWQAIEAELADGPLLISPSGSTTHSSAPTFSRPGPTDRVAGDRRGPLHLRLGSRLPARLPPPEVLDLDHRCWHRGERAGHG